MHSQRTSVLRHRQYLMFQCLKPSIRMEEKIYMKPKFEGTWL